jgi:hypothetical protein
MLLLLTGATWSCGYHVSGHADLLPKHIKSIAIPAFGNLSTRYRLAQRQFVRMEIPPLPTKYVLVDWLREES